MKKETASGNFVNLDSGTYYKIENVHTMPAFFINIATASDIWAFLSSNGGLTVGRQNSGGAIFPYETDDRLHLATGTGPKTLFRLEDGRIWAPFNTDKDNPFKIRRNIYKRNTGDAVLFEEINDTLSMTFSYRWETSEKYGIVRTASLKNKGGNEVSMAMLDGVENIIPYGITQGLLEGSSCLTDAYKACERFSGNLAIYSLTSVIVDSPEPVDMLRANIIWHIGEAQSYLLSSKQIDNFVLGGTPEDETNSVGRKGAYLAYQPISLAAGAEEDWMLILDARLSQKQVSALAKELSETPADKLRKNVMADIANGTTELTRVVSAADGLQKTADTRADVRHYMNVLYNNMRGGIFLDGYSYDPELFARFVASRDKALAERRKDFLDKLCDSKDGNVLQLHELAYADGDSDIIRLCLEFLPLTFSRRHGDPSRPWNRFNIQVKDDNGNPVYHYEGNWRDIFQNWESMTLSFPGYIAPVIAKFLNASTADGFNPYRISGDGIDWECPEPNNPFSGFGYWGDHQIVYLNKLLEWLSAYAPNQLDNMFTKEIFAYADVPYHLNSYAEILKDGKNTITFAQDRHDMLMKRAAEYGSDGKLIMKDGEIYRVSFIEKLLVPILAKLANLVPSGGIWMNTQRPEWNDANNAIVGYGLSMVTVYQLYRHLLFCKKLLENRSTVEVSVSAEVLHFVEDIHKIFSARSEKTPRVFLDEAGKVFETYRMKVYADGFDGKETISMGSLIAFIDEAIAALAETIDANKREDGMYHAYNILTLTKDSLKVSPLFLMLEGQTSVLGSGRLTSDEALALVEKMEKSGLMSDEQNTFFLYPKKKLKTFMERNIIPNEAAAGSALIGRLLADGHDELVLQDADGNIRFHDGIQQSSNLKERLSAVLSDERYQSMASEADTIWDIYELVFAHRQFTGRSGIMYKFEGIGSIYWHQNSKFILSFQEAFSTAAMEKHADLLALKDAYYRLRAGLGFNKEPSLWGAFPLEPYSHTPYGMPAQQPGMTGQVKEDILTRLTEMGISAQNGILLFDPALLRKPDFLTQPDSFRYINLDGEVCDMTLDADSLGFTVCQTPVVYRLSAEKKIEVFLKNGETETLSGLALNEELSRALFTRDGSIQRVEVSFTENMLI